MSFCLLESIYLVFFSTLVAVVQYSLVGAGECNHFIKKPVPLIPQNVLFLSK